MENRHGSSSYAPSRASLPIQRPLLTISNHKLQNMNMIYQFQGAKLYLGDIVSTIKLEVLSNNHITAILSCIADQKSLSNTLSTILEHLSTSKASQQINHHKIIAAQDVPEYPLIQHFSQAFDFIDQMMKNIRNILVHCHAGLSRSATIVCAYLMRKNGWSCEEAVNFVKTKRNRIRPNEGFMKMLKGYEMANRISKTNQNSQQKIIQPQKMEPSRCLRSIDNHKISHHIFEAQQKHPQLRHQNTHMQNRHFSPSIHFSPAPKINFCQSRSRISTINPENLKASENWNPQSRTRRDSVRGRNENFGNLSQQEEVLRSRKTSFNEYIREPHFQINLSKKVQSELIRCSDSTRKKFGQVFKDRILSKTDTNIVTNSQRIPYLQFNNLPQNTSPHKNIFSSFSEVNTSISKAT